MTSSAASRFSVAAIRLRASSRGRIASDIDAIGGSARCSLALRPLVERQLLAKGQTLDRMLQQGTSL